MILITFPFADRDGSLVERHQQLHLVLQSLPVVARSGLVQPASMAKHYTVGRLQIVLRLLPETIGLMYRKINSSQILLVGLPALQTGVLATEGLCTVRSIQRMTMMQPPGMGAMRTKRNLSKWNLMMRKMVMIHPRKKSYHTPSSSH